jgi:anti-sigma regulatory factor (Ser/Thr protein kinase)
MTSAPAHAAARPDTAPAPLPARTGRTRSGPATRQTSLILGPLATAPGTARGTLHTALILWGLAHLSDTAGQITSELVTNAITASRAAAPPGTEPRPITLWISARDQELCIRVWDPDPTPPPLHQPPPDPLTEHGRGLLIVSALSHQWGSHPAPNGGKYVWAGLRTLTGDTPAALNAAIRADRVPEGTL